METIHRLLQKNSDLAEKNVQMAIGKYFPKRNNAKLFKFLEFLADYNLLIIDIFNRIVNLKSVEILRDDFEFLYQFSQKYKIRTVLEFGPGASTYCFLKLKDVLIYSYEHNEKWLQLAQEKFKNYPNVRIFKFENKENDEIKAVKPFDLGFIDSSLGDFSIGRLNTCLYASKYTNLIILHDSKREGEKRTIKYLEAHGWEASHINTVKGLCVLRKLDSHISS